MVCLGFEPGDAGEDEWKAHTNPQSSDGPKDAHKTQCLL